MFEDLINNKKFMVDYDVNQLYPEAKVLFSIEISNTEKAKKERARRVKKLIKYAKSLDW